MGQQDNILVVRFIKRNGKLEPINSGVAALHKAFVDGLEEGQEVQQFLEAYKDDGTNLQLAKIHVYIRKLAVELGYTFEEMKQVIKQNAGLIHGEQVKSLAHCSKEELGLVMEAIKEACMIANIYYD
jgi:hypothetical protein